MNFRGRSYIDSSYRKLVGRLNQRADARRTVLANLSRKTFGDRFTAQLCNSKLTTKAVGRMPEMLIKEIVKRIATIAAQRSSKQALKSVAKKIPIAGLLIGGYMGGKRLIKGDFGIAAMEVGSGALACVPGELQHQLLFGWTI